MKKKDADIISTKLKSNSTYTLLLFLIFIIFNIGSLLVSTLIDQSRTFEIIDFFALVSLVQFIFSLSIFYSVDRTLISFVTIFYVTSNLFHLGQLFLILFNVNIETIVYTNTLVSADVFIKSCKYIFLCHMFYTFGFVFYNIYPRKNIRKVKKEKTEEYDLKILKKIGWFLFFLGIIPKIYIDVNKMILFLNGAYINTYDFSISGYIALIASLSDYGILILMISYKNHKKILNSIFLTGVLYQGIIIFTGNRGEAIIFIILLSFLYIKIQNSFSLKNFIYISLTGYLALIIINIVGDTRSLLNRDFNTLMYYLEENIGFYPFWRILAEFGSSITSVAYSIQFFPQYAPVQYGGNYLSSILTIFPNIGGILNDIVINTQYVKFFPYEKSNYIGGSYIGETYFSFNAVGPIIVLFIGIFISHISKKIEKSFLEKDWILLSFMLVFVSNILWWNRDYFGSMIREIVWINSLIYFLLTLIKVKKTRFK